MLILHDIEDSHCKRSGFTIVELLIVIVVIVILSAIAIVAFTGVQQRAGEAQLKTELTSAAKQLANHNTRNGHYPANTNDIQRGDEITFQYTYDAGTNSYCLTGSSRWGEYYISNGSMNPQAGICSGHVSYLNGSPWIIADHSISASSQCQIYEKQAWCWGGSDYGARGDGLNTSSQIPRRGFNVGALSGKEIRHISTGYLFRCVVSEDQRIYCAGRNNSAELGQGSASGGPTSAYSTPMEVSDPSNYLSGKTIADIGSTTTSTCAVTTDNAILCWGSNSSGQLGNGTFDSPAAVSQTNTSNISGAGSINKITGGGSHYCVLTSLGRVFCWGSNSVGQLGNNSTTSSNVPIEISVDGGKTVKDISTGQNHTCASTTDNFLYCWGDNFYAQSGSSSNIGSNSNRPHVPVPTALNISILNSATIDKIVAGGYHSCIIAANSTYCWGRNSNGELGNGSTATAVYQLTKADTTGVLDGQNISKITLSSFTGGGGSSTTCVSNSYNIYCWGNNAGSQFGNNSAIDSLIPVLTHNPSS